MIWLIICEISIFIAIALMLILAKKYNDEREKNKIKHDKILSLYQQNYDFYNFIREQRNIEMRRLTIMPNDKTSTIRIRAYKDLENEMKKRGLI